MNARTRITITAAALLLAAATSLLAEDRDLDARESYSYVRSLEGRATLASQGSAPGEEASLNQPLLTGDRVSVARGARVEIALADRNLVRVGGDSTLILSLVAFSGDREERATRLDLEDGEIVLTVTDDALGDELPTVRTPGAEVVIHRPGTYRIETAPEGWTEVVVRAGFAEVVTGGGSTVVREDESAYASAGRSGVELAEAGPFDALESWGDELSTGARQAELYVEPELSYHAAPLANYGSWVSVNSAWYWQPRVEVGWRPYWRGRWGWTPSGLTWISSEPWGWMPYHYGSWSSMPGYGWMWRPGRFYSPAWVYWHWSDAWVGWCPTGYYTNWYGSDFGFRFGIYGWAGGGWGSYNDWNFAPTHCLRRRDQGRWMRRGGDLGRELGARVPRGVITTETRGLPRDRFADRGFASGELARRARLSSEGDLADVTDFVARRRDLPRQVLDVVRSEPGRRGIPTASDETRTRSSRGDGQGGSEDRDGRVFTRPRTESRGDGGADERRVITRPRTEPRSEGGADERRVITRPRTEPRSEGGADERRVITRPRTEPRSEGGADERRVITRPRTEPRSEGGGDGQAVRPNRDTNPRPPVTDRRAPSAERRGSATEVRPGGTVEIDSNGRVRPFARSDEAGQRVLSRPRTGGDGGYATQPRTGPDTNPRPSERQGWRGREGGSEASGGPVRSPAPGAYRAPQARRDEPVQRVLGGIRSGGASGSERGGERGWQAPAQGPRSDSYRPTPRPSAPRSDSYRPAPRPSAPRSDSYRPAPRPSAPRSDSYRPAPRPSAPRSDSYRPTPRPSAPRSTGPRDSRSAPPASYGAPGVRSTPRGSSPSASPQRPSSGGSSSRSSTSPPPRSSSERSKSSSGSRGSSRGQSSPPRRSGGG